MDDSRKRSQITLTPEMEHAGAAALRRADSLSDEAAARAVFVAMLSLTRFRPCIRKRPEPVDRSIHPWDLPPRRSRPRLPALSPEQYAGMARGPWRYHYWNRYDRLHYFKHGRDGMRRCLRLTDAMLADPRLDDWIAARKIKEF